MAVLKLTALGGLYPSVSARALPDNGAQVSLNLLPHSNEFVPLRNNTLTFDQLGTAPLTTANPKLIYRFDRDVNGDLNTDDTVGWVATAANLSYAKSQLNNDSLGRVYYTDDDSGGAYVLTADETIRTLGLTRPTVTPTTSVVYAYYFTSDLWESERESAKQQAIRADGITPALVGPNLTFPITGWVMESDFAPTLAGSDKYILRVFALDPTTDAIIDTYSDMSVTEAGWVLDPSLNGYAATAPVGYTPPAWASGHSKWWCIRFRIYAEGGDVDQPTYSTALQAIDKPGTQGAEKLFDSTTADALALFAAELLDKDVGEVASMRDQLVHKQADVAALFAYGGSAQLAAAVRAFYASADVSGSIADNTTAFANVIWGYIYRIGSVTNPGGA